MRNYFNGEERNRHIVIMCMRYTIEEMLESNAITEQEKNHLTKTIELLDKFSNSTFERFGEAYKRKISNTLEVNTVKLVGKYSKNQDGLLDVSLEDILPFVKEIMFNCVACDKCNFLNCGIYKLALACNIEGHTQSGCPYRESIGDLDL